MMPSDDRKANAHDVPTLPTPPLWRLVAAAVVVIAFLFFMYHSYEPEVPPAPVSTQGAAPPPSDTGASGRSAAGG